jgi:tripartite-type tricarboxylate transporter receptor subunit TctC
MRFLLFVIAAFLSLEGKTENYPSKPIRLLVPFAPGGSSSIVARLAAEEMSKGLGQPIVIENKGGGGGNLAMQEAAQAEPDGYTLIIGHIGSLAVNPYMYDKLPYDVDRTSPRCRARHRAGNFRRVPRGAGKDLPAGGAEEKPGELFYGSAGNAAGARRWVLKQTAGIDLKHVPYKGTGLM